MRDIKMMERIRMHLLRNPLTASVISLMLNMVTEEEAISYCFSPLARILSIQPTQVREEISALLSILKEIQPLYILEIGTGSGGSLFLFTRVAEPNAVLITIDLPGGPFGGGYPEWKIPLYLSFAKANQKIYLLREDSHNPRTLSKVESILGDRKLDFLFIDGDHSYEGVKRDFEMYGHLVKRGGIIAFHDIVPGPPEKTGGVPKFWNEIRVNYVHKELVKDRSQGGYGIGIIFV